MDPPLSVWQALSRFLLPLSLIGIWGWVLADGPSMLPLRAASWITFLALLVTPGYLLGEVITWRLRLDAMERLALAFPLSVAVLAGPGMMALLQHGSIAQLAETWTLVSAGVVAVWVMAAAIRRRPADRAERWHGDQIVWLALIVAGFIAIAPTLSLSKIDGDAYAVGSFSADALAGLPLNASEPLFGTDLGPGVRMAFNQSLPMAYLWSWFSGVDAITLTASASRTMVALWALLAAYALGRAAGLTLPGNDNSRRFALLLVSTQLLIYVAAPFFRGDNVSIFFFERTTADKFMVPVTMLPVVFAFAMRYLGSGRRDAWLAAALATFAVSTIHPLIAAMLALALGSFAGFHLLLHLRRGQAWARTVAVGAIIALAMALPLVQLYLSRGEAPLAASYPSNIEGWPVGHKLTPALPFLNMPTLEVYGPLPDLARLEASEAESNANPFLIWRFAVNMERRRLILFDLEHYISDPNIILEPPYLLALLLLPAALWRLRSNLAAQFVVSTALATLLVMFNPFVTPLIGSLVMPWILWRFVWLLPYALILALALYRLLALLFGAQLTSATSHNRYAPLAATVAIALIVSPSMVNTVQRMQLRAAFPYYYPTPTALFQRIETLSADGPGAMVVADQDLSVTLPAYVAKANVMAHRVPTTSEIFPADRQVEALQRLIDQETFFRSRYLTEDAIDVLRRYEADYVIAPSGSNLDIQLRLASDWFEHLEDDQSYSLYAVRSLPVDSNAIRGNTLLNDRLWRLAERAYTATLSGEPGDALAIAGLAEIAHAQGQFSDAVRYLNLALLYTGEPALHYRLGQIYSEMAQPEKSFAAFEKAHAAAPTIARYSEALGDACLAAERIDCAREQFTLAVANSDHPDEISRIIGLADLWRQRNMFAQALPLYEEAAKRWPSINNQLMLANVYLETNRYAQAGALLAAVRAAHPLSVEAVALAGTVEAAQGNVDEAVALMTQAVTLLKIQGQDIAETQLGLVQILTEAGRLDEAQASLSEVLSLEPNNASAYSLQGDLHLHQHEMEAAMQAYQLAFQLDPTQVSTYIAMTNEMRRQGGRQDHILELLERAIVSNPDEAMLALALGDQAERRGETDAAINAYQSALDMFERDIAPGVSSQRSNNLSRAYAYARLAGVSEDKGELEPAMNYYRAAVAAVPELPWPRVILGDALRRRGELEAAAAAYEGAVAVDAQHLDAYMRLTDLYSAQGEAEVADAYRRQALTLAFDDTTEKPAAGSRYGLGSPTPGVASQFSIAFASGETLTNAQSAAADPDAAQQVQQVVTPITLNFSDGNDATLRLLTQIYRNDNQPEQAIAFYKEIIAAGKDAGWGGAALATYHKGLGDLYLLVDMPAEAAASYRSAIALDTWWPQPRLGLARATADLGGADAALAQLRETVDLAPGYVEARVALASALETFGQGDEALAIYQQTAENHAGNANATLAYAHALRDRGDREAAETLYRQTLTLNPGNADAHVELAGQLIDDARYAEAQPLLDRAMIIDQQNVNTYLQAGLLKQRQGEFEDALDWFNRATELKSDSPSINITLIDMFQRNGHYEPAIAYIKEQLGQEPNDVDLLARLSSSLRAVGRYGEALATLLQAEQSELKDARLAAELGELYLAQGRPRAAIAAYQQAIKLQPDEHAYYLRGSEILRGQGEYAHGVSLLRSGLERAAEPAALYAAMVELHLDLGQIDLAKRTLDEAFSLVGNEIEIVLAEGAFQAAADGAAAAKAWYAAQLAERPDEPALYVALGNLALNSGRPEEAVEMFETAVALDGQDASHHALLASAYLAQKRGDEAIAAYERAILLEPTLGDAYAALAQLYAANGRIEKAREQFERGMAVAPTDGILQVAYSRFLLDQGEIDAALKRLAAIDQVAPTADMLVARAALFDTLDRNAEALHDLELAIQKEPGAVDAYMALSNLYRKLDKETEADAVLKDLQSRLPSLGYEAPKKR